MIVWDITTIDGIITYTFILFVTFAVIYIITELVFRASGAQRIVDELKIAIGDKLPMTKAEYDIQLPNSNGADTTNCKNGLLDYAKAKEASDGAGSNTYTSGLYTKTREAQMYSYIHELSNAAHNPYKLATTLVGKPSTDCKMGTGDAKTDCKPLRVMNMDIYHANNLRLTSLIIAVVLIHVLLILRPFRPKPIKAEPAPMTTISKSKSRKGKSSKY